MNNTDFLGVKQTAGEFGQANDPENMDVNTTVPDLLIAQNSVIEDSATNPYAIEGTTMEQIQETLGPDVDIATWCANNNMTVQQLAEIVNRYRDIDIRIPEESEAPVANNVQAQEQTNVVPRI